MLSDTPKALSNHPPKSGHRIVITPRRTGPRIDWQGVWEYRDMLIFLVRRDFFAKYKQTVLGPAWFIIQPLLTTLVFYIIFGKVAKLSTDGIPAGLFYLCGNIGWFYFAQSFQNTSTTFITNAPLFTKVYFPRIVLPISSVISNLFALSIQLLILIGFWIYFKYFTDAGDAFHLSPLVAFYPLLVIFTMLVSLGVGLWMSALTAKYRDLSHISSFILQIGLYATTVIYPLSEVMRFFPEGLRWVLGLNPMITVVELYRLMFLGESALTWQIATVSALVTFTMLWTGILIFNEVQRRFADFA